jgi:hypothetical protein
MRFVRERSSEPLAATVDGCFERALVHLRPALDPEPLGLSEELLLGSFLALRHASPLSSSVNNTDAYPGEFIPNGQDKRENSETSANLVQHFPNVCLSLAVRAAPRWV